MLFFVLQLFRQYVSYFSLFSWWKVVFLLSQVGIHRLLISLTGRIESWADHADTQQRRFFGMKAHQQAFYLQQTRERPNWKKQWSFFFLDALKTAFQIRHLTHRWTQGNFFLKSGHFFWFSNKGNQFPRPLCVRTCHGPTWWFLNMKALDW